MVKNTCATLIFKNFSSSSLAYVRKLCTTSQSQSDMRSLRDSMEQKRRAIMQQHQALHNRNASIYRVPAKFRKTDPRAYQPHFVSIGPFHRGSALLQDAERLKWDCLDRVVGSSAAGNQFRENHDNMLSVLDAIEPQARGCYSEEVKLSRDEFVEMMLLDGCFVVELLRDLKRNEFAASYLLCKRWMLPVVRRDLITLENQLPMAVLEKIFEQTNPPNSTSLVELALRFFDPLMPRGEALLQQTIIAGKGTQNDFHHLLDVFHSSVSLGDQVKRQKEPHMFRTATDLRHEGVKIVVARERSCNPLELRFEDGKLKIPNLQISNHTGCIFRNMVAYEQCHRECHPDMTAYLFFLDKLINSAQDVELLHRKKVIEHTLGSNQQVATLINNLCLDFEHDGQDSYLYQLIQSINEYTDQWWVKQNAKLMHDHFSSLWRGLQTIAAALLIYLSLVQTCCSAVDAQLRYHEWHKIGGLWTRFASFFVKPGGGINYFELGDPPTSSHQLIMLNSS